MTTRPEATTEELWQGIARLKRRIDKDFTSRNSLLLENLLLKKELSYYKNRSKDLTYSNYWLRDSLGLTKITTESLDDKTLII